LWLSLFFDCFAGMVFHKFGFRLGKRVTGVEIIVITVGDKSIMDAFGDTPVRFVSFRDWNLWLF